MQKSFDKTTNIDVILMDKEQSNIVTMIPESAFENVANGRN